MWCCTRWDGIGNLVDGQAGPCMVGCMGGAWVHGGGAVLGWVGL